MLGAGNYLAQIVDLLLRDALPLAFRLTIRVKPMIALSGVRSSWLMIGQEDALSPVRFFG